MSSRLGCGVARGPRPLKRSAACSPRVGACGAPRPIVRCALLVAASYPCRLVGALRSLSRAPLCLAPARALLLRSRRSLVSAPRSRSLLMFLAVIGVVSSYRFRCAERWRSLALASARGLGKIGGVQYGIFSVLRHKLKKVKIWFVSRFFLILQSQGCNKTPINQYSL